MAGIDIGDLKSLSGMVERNVGAVLVFEDGLLVGIMTERDLMRALARGLRDDAVVADDDCGPGHDRARRDRARRRADDPRWLPPSARRRRRRRRRHALDPRPRAANARGLSAPRWRMSSSTGSAGDPGRRRGPPVRERVQDDTDRDPAHKDEQRPEQLRAVEVGDVAQRVRRRRAARRSDFLPRRGQQLRGSRETPKPGCRS